MSTAVPSLLTLLDAHTELEALFLAHQTALLDRNLAAADVALRQFAEMLKHHIDDEETHILPVYAARVPPPEGGKVEFFQKEHNKLLRVLGELQEMLILLAPTGQPLQFGDVIASSDPLAISARGVIELLDKEASFKDLFLHHDARERNFLYPLLAAELSPSEQSAILERIETTTRNP